MEPKCDPRGTKIEDKNEDEKRRFRRSSWSRLGSILGRLGCRLGVIVVLSLERVLDFEKSRLWRKKTSRDDLRSILGRFGSPKGGPDEGRGGSEEELS